MHQQTRRSQFRSTSCLTVGSGVHVFVIKTDHCCADKAIIALPLTAENLVLLCSLPNVTQRSSLFPLRHWSTPCSKSVSEGSQRSPRCISVNTRSQVGPQWFLYESLPSRDVAARTMETRCKTSFADLFSTGVCQSLARPLECISPLFQTWALSSFVESFILWRVQLVSDE